MICKRRGQGWEIIFQRNHAMLAAEMLAPWSPDKRPEPWVQLLNACSQHDHGWNETVSDALVNDQGTPLDFLHMPQEATLAMSRRNLENADAQSRWCAILVARHAEYLYSFKDDDETKAYVAEVQAFRQVRMAEIGVSDQQVEDMYELLCWADSLSLLICCDPSEFTKSLALVAQGQEFQAEEQEDGGWSLNPWPYDQPTVSLEYEIRSLQQSTFATSEELRRALYDCPVQVKKLELRR